MKYLKPLFSLLKLPLFGSLPVAALIGFAVYAFSQNRLPVWKPVCVAVLVWLVLWIVLFAMLAAALKKEQPLEDILVEQGYCDAWLQKHSEIYPQPDRQQKLVRVDVLSFLGRYDEARTLLESIPTAAMSDDREFEYNNAWLDMLLKTGHYGEAIQKFADCRKFMDIYANANPMRGAVYGLNAAVILALQGDYEGSEHYLRTAEHRLSGNSAHRALVRIATVMQHYALGFTPQAEELEATVKAEIQNEPEFSKPWLRDHLLQMLSRAKALSPENRQEVPAT